MATDDRVYETPENKADLELCVELSERVSDFCQKRKGKAIPVGHCIGRHPIAYWCGDCIKLHASNRIAALWGLIEKERRERQLKESA
jgi:hypothetical protein